MNPLMAFRDDGIVDSTPLARCSTSSPRLAAAAQQRWLTRAAASRSSRVAVAGWVAASRSGSRRRARPSSRSPAAPASWPRRNALRRSRGSRHGHRVRCRRLRPRSARWATRCASARGPHHPGQRGGRVRAHRAHRATWTPQDWVRTIQIDAIAPFLTVRAFLAGMLEAGWGASSTSPRPPRSIRPDRSTAPTARPRSRSTSSPATSPRRSRARGHRQRHPPG